MAGWRWGVGESMRPFIIVIEWRGCGEGIVVFMSSRSEERNMKTRRRENEMCNKKASQLDL